MGQIHVGIGGWNFAPWRGAFYPSDLPASRELEYASRAVTSIEINATFYRTQSASSFRRWRDTAPDGFVFALKAPRAATHLRVLADAGPAVERFLASGVVELGTKLGPILWQFPPTRRFDPDALAAFLELLPAERDGLALRHVIEARHPSFVDARFPALLAHRAMTVALVDSPKHPMIEQEHSTFVYVRLQRSVEEEPCGYTPEALDGWAEKAKGWARQRDCFFYFIDGAKLRAPAAAGALISRLG
jgi:uncharacterized protein YecE (DUF72 family)